MEQPLSVKSVALPAETERVFQSGYKKKKAQDLKIRHQETFKSPPINFT